MVKTDSKANGLRFFSFSSIGVETETAKKRKKGKFRRAWKAKKVKPRRTTVLKTAEDFFLAWKIDQKESPRKK